MLKIESNNGKLTVEAMGTMCDIQKDVGRALSAIASRMNDKEAEVFKITFIQAVMSGKIFDCTAEEMERLDAKRREHYNNDNSANPWDAESELDRILSGLNDALKEVLKQLEEHDNEDE